jgi:putative aminopeptidase FrvX
LFQKECLWNIGAKKIANNVDNFIFIDIDTFPQDKNLFSKANKY